MTFFPKVYPLGDVTYWFSIPVSMDNMCPDGNENQYVTSPSGEALGRNFNVRRSKHIRNSPQRYNPYFGAAREWKNDAVASIVYMIQDRDYDSNVDTGKDPIVTG